MNLHNFFQNKFHNCQSNTIQSNTIVYIVFLTINFTIVEHSIFILAHHLHYFFVYQLHNSQCHPVKIPTLHWWALYNHYFLFKKKMACLYSYIALKLQPPLFFLFFVFYFFSNLCFCYNPNFNCLKEQRKNVEFNIIFQQHSRR